MKPPVSRVAVFAVLAVLVMTPAPAAASADPPPSTPPSTLPSTPLRAVDGVIAPTPPLSPTGTYVVLLRDPPAAGQSGGAAPGAFDPDAPRAQRYAAQLAERQREVAEAAGVQILESFQMVLNGFSAALTPDDLARVSALPEVAQIVPDELLRPDAAPGGTGGVPVSAVAAPDDGGADAGADGAGADGGATVIGVVDTGIVTGNPSLPPATIADARVFGAAALAGSLELGRDSASPTDRSGHGTAMAGIAAGASVVADVGGRAVGEIVGVAPDARVASYKACFAGADPSAGSDDVCVSSDVIAAVDGAVADGVDVVALALSRVAGPGPWELGDLALQGAAAAGVFVAVSAGNAGPAASSVTAGAPWYTTVAAATTGAYAATVQLESGPALPGISASLADEVTAPVLVGADAPRLNPEDARLCFADALDAALVAGAIVVCERGTNTRDEKARAVAAAGGVGMILVDPAGDALEPVFDLVPTVQLDAEQGALLRAALAAERSPVATLAAGEAPNGAVPAPQVADFSGRGPGPGGLGPDVTAPGVGILAPTRQGAGGQAQWDLFSGTSMAVAHVAGLAARYFAEHPGADPAEVRSALVTTAVDTLSPDGSPMVDPFVQGAGHVDPDRMPDPGLVYLDDPSISVAGPTRSHAETRSLTALRPGTYRAVVSVPGIEATVTPAELTFATAGETQEFTVTFAADRAPADVWAGGYLTWIAADGTSTVRTPLAVRPAAVGAAPVLTGAGTDGAVELGVQAPPRVAGIGPVTLLVDPAVPAPGHSGNADSGDENGRIAWIVRVPDAAALAEITLTGTPPAEPPLTVYRLVGDDTQAYTDRWDAELTPDDRRVRIDDPIPGDYLVVVDVDRAAEGKTWDLRAVIVAGGTALAVSAPTGSYAATWAGLDPEREYVGVIAYDGTAERTLLRIQTGPEGPVAQTPPSLSGEPRVGERLELHPGSWSPEDSALSFQWLKDGVPIPGADRRTYLVQATDAGASLSARVQARRPGALNAGTALTEPVDVTVGSRVRAELDRTEGTATDDYRVTVSVRTDPGQPAGGAVTVTLAGVEYVGTLVGGRVAFALPAPAPGIHEVAVRYAGTAGVSPSETSVELTVTG